MVQEGSSVTLTTYYLGTAKDAAYAEIPLVGSSGDGIAMAEKLTGLKVSSNTKAVKASIDKKNNVLKVSTAGLGTGMVTLSGTLKDGTTSVPYIAYMNIVSQQPVMTATEIGYKDKGAKEISYVSGNLRYPMQTGDSLAVSVRFYNSRVGGYYTYGGGKNAGVWQSQEPAYLSVSADGKIKALAPTENGRAVKAVFIDYLGQQIASVDVPITPKPNTKIDAWKTSLSFQVKGLSKGSVAQTVSPGMSMNWTTSEGPFQLTTTVVDTKSQKPVKANVFYYSTQPDYIAIDSKGVLYPLKSMPSSVTARVYAVGIDFAGLKEQSYFNLSLR